MTPITLEALTEGVLAVLHERQHGKRPDPNARARLAAALIVDHRAAVLNLKPIVTVDFYRREPA